MDFSKTGHFRLPAPPKEAYGPQAWLDNSLDLKYLEGIPEHHRNSWPPVIAGLRCRNLSEVVHPLLFMRGPWSAWFAHGTPADKKAGHPTADITRLEPAPLGRYFDCPVTFGPARDDGKDYQLSANSRSKEYKYLPALVAGTSSLPAEIWPVKYTTKEIVTDGDGEQREVTSYKYVCCFPRCSVPLDEFTTSRGATTRHIMQEHLGLLPICPFCLGTMETCDEKGYHVKQQADGTMKRLCKGPLKAIRDDILFYGYVTPTEWQIMGTKSKALIDRARASALKLHRDSVNRRLVNRPEKSSIGKTPGSRKKKAETLANSSDDSSD